MTVAWFAQPFSGGPISLSRLRKPIQSPAGFRRATLISSAPSRETIRRSPFVSSVRRSSSRSPRRSSDRLNLIAVESAVTDRRYRLREQTAGVLRLHHPLDSDRHGGGAMRN